MILGLVSLPLACGDDDDNNNNSSGGTAGKAGSSSAGKAGAGKGGSGGASAGKGGGGGKGGTAGGGTGGSTAGTGGSTGGTGGSTAGRGGTGGSTAGTGGSTAGTGGSTGGNAGGGAGGEMNGGAGAGAADQGGAGQGGAPPTADEIRQAKCNAICTTPVDPDGAAGPEPAAVCTGDNATCAAGLCTIYYPECTSVTDALIDCIQAAIAAHPDELTCDADTMQTSYQGIMGTYCSDQQAAWGSCT